MACFQGHKQTVETLITAKADVNAPVVFSSGAYGVVSDGMTPLFGAAMKGSVDVIKLLLDAGATIGQATSSTDTATPRSPTTQAGVTALHVAAYCGQDLAIALLVEAKADLDSKAVRDYLCLISLCLTLCRSCSRPTLSCV